MGLFRRDKNVSEQPAVEQLQRTSEPSHAMTGEPTLVRSPSFATIQPVSTGFGIGAGMPAAGGTAWSDEQAWRLAYYSTVWFYRCVQVIAEDLATLPLRVGKDPNEPGAYDLKHPLAILLGPPPGTPNPETSARRLWQWTVAQWLVGGRFAWEIEYGPSGLPMFLWPLPQTRITPVESKGGDRYFDAYDFDMGQGRLKRIPRERVVYDWKPSGLDWRKPENVLQAAKLDVSVVVMQDRYDYAFLKNDARPAAIVVHEQFTNVDERDAWRSQLVSTHQGPDNAGKMAFSETSPGGAKPADALLIQTLGLSQKDAEFIARYDAKLKSIEVAMGVPRSRLGDSSARTYANAGEEWKGYWRTTVKNLAIDLADSINTRLAPKFGLDVCWFDFTGNEWLRDEPPFPVEQAVPLQRAGLVTVNEVRTKVLYLPPSDDPAADELKAQPTVADMLSQQPAPAAEPDDDEAEPEDAPDQPDAADMEDAGQTEKGAPVRLLRVVSDDDVAAAREHARAERRRAVFRAVDDTTKALETKWERRVARLFQQQLDATLARLTGKRGRQAFRDSDTPPDVNTIFDMAYWRNATQELGEDLYEDTLTAALASYSGTFGISLSLDNPWAKDFIQQRANQLAGQITQTTYDGIKDQLISGAAEGESIDKLAARIEHLFAQTYSGRARTVARTEVISGYNGGTYEAIRNTPLDVSAGQEWIATLDERTRDAHAEMDGVIVGVGESFDVDGEALQYPGDPNGSPENVINCRCTLAPVAPEDMPGARTARNAVPVEQALEALAHVAARARTAAQALAAL